MNEKQRDGMERVGETGERKFSERPGDHIGIDYRTIAGEIITDFTMSGKAADYSEDWINGVTHGVAKFAKRLGELGPTSTSARIAELEQDLADARNGWESAVSENNDAAPVVAVVAADLPNSIINLPCDKSKANVEYSSLAYEHGHHDALDAAAELVSAALASQAQAAVSAPVQVYFQEMHRSFKADQSHPLAAYVGSADFYYRAYRAGLAAQAAVGVATWTQEMLDGVNDEAEALQAKFGVAKVAEDAVGVASQQQPELVLALPDYEQRRIEVASDEMVDGKRHVCLAISGEDGLKLVPVEPTEAMIHAAEDILAPRPFGKVWRAMLGAAPMGSCNAALRAAPDSQPDATFAAKVAPYRVGNEYQTLAGDWVRLVGVANEGTSYESMFDAEGINRYTRRDFGRVTGSPHDYSDPLNLPPLYTLPVESNAARRFRAPGGNTNDNASPDLASIASQAHNLDALQRYDHRGALMVPDQTGDYLLISDVRSFVETPTES